MSGSIDTLESLGREISDAAAQLRGVAEPLTDGQLNWRPAERRWSIGECIEHVALTNESYTRKFSRLAETGKLLRGDSPWKRSLTGRIFLWMMEPPPRGRVKAPVAFMPSSSSLQKDEVIARFETAREALLEVVQDFEGVDLSRTRVSSPVARWLRFDLGSALAILAAHERRHLWQVLKIASEPDFPG